MCAAHLVFRHRHRHGVASAPAPAATSPASSVVRSSDEHLDGRSQIPRRTFSERRCHRRVTPGSVRHDSRGSVRRTRRGGSGAARGRSVLFTAPHGVYLRREVVTANGPGLRTHVPEQWTSFIALAFAGTRQVVHDLQHRANASAAKPRGRSIPATSIRTAYRPTSRARTTGASCCAGSRTARVVRDRSPATDGGTRAWFHVDVHGRRDPEVSHETLGPGDVDIGTGALRADRPELADALAESPGKASPRVFRNRRRRFSGARTGETKRRKGVSASTAPRSARRARRRAHDPVAAERASRARQRAAGAVAAAAAGAEGRPGESEGLRARRRRGVGRNASKRRNASK